MEPGVTAIRAPREPSDIENDKHSLTRIRFQLCCTACVKGKKHEQIHTRESNGHMFMTDVAASDGLKVLNMYSGHLGMGCAQSWKRRVLMCLQL